MPPIPRPDCRRFVCDRCRAAVYICSWCDRGHRYCSRQCSSAARSESRRAAGRLYQATPNGRRNHASRQAAYRDRQAVELEKVTHHGCRDAEPSATVAACTRSTTSAPSRGETLVCCFCNSICLPFVRDDFLRCRRPRGGFRRFRGARDDLQSSGGRDSSSVHG